MPVQLAKQLAHGSCGGRNIVSPRRKKSSPAWNVRTIVRDRVGNRKDCPVAVVPVLVGREPSPAVGRRPAVVLGVVEA